MSTENNTQPDSVTFTNDTGQEIATELPAGISEITPAPVDNIYACTRCEGPYCGNGWCETTLGVDSGVEATGPDTVKAWCGNDIIHLPTEAQGRLWIQAKVLEPHLREPTLDPMYPAAVAAGEAFTAAMATA